MKNYKLIAIGALLAASFTSCELTEKPVSTYEKDTYFTTPERARMAVAGIYDSFSNKDNYGQNEMAMPSSDDTYYIQGTGTDNTRRDISHYMVKNTNTWVLALWKMKYQGIDRASVAIDGIEHMGGFQDDPTLRDLAAQAHFLRAVLSFDLIKYWGDVPYKSTFTAGYDAAFTGRVDRELIYDEIIKDLDFAKNNLKTGDGLSPEVPSQGAAHAMLMRVYLQRAGYSLKMNGQLTRPDETKRQEYFKAVIAEWTAMKTKGYHGFYDGGFKQLFMGYSAGVLNSKESLWEIAFNPTGQGYTDNAGIWATYNGPLVAQPSGNFENAQTMGRANAFFRVLPAWKDFFEDTDERRDVMVCTYQYKWQNGAHVKAENPKVQDWYPGKWRREWMPLGFVDPNNTGVNFCLLRYADAVLMAAEAYNETNNTSEAWTLLNQVRSRAGATPIDVTTNYATLLKAPKVYDITELIPDNDEQGKFRTALFWERGFELAFEGQRKYDLLRWGILAETLKLAEKNMDASLSGRFVAGTKFIKGQHELFPIPLSELQANAALNMQNNPGY